MSEKLKPTQDAPVAETKGEKQKEEWGPELGQMTWNEAQAKIAEINASLVESKKKWRLPNFDELYTLFAGVFPAPKDFKKDASYLIEGKEWAGYDLFMGNLGDKIHNDSEKYRVQLVRNID